MNEQRKCVTCEGYFVATHLDERCPHCHIKELEGRLDNAELVQAMSREWERKYFEAKLAIKELEDKLEGMMLAYEICKDPALKRKSALGQL
jgi:hypothetical protein